MDYDYEKSEAVRLCKLDKQEHSRCDLCRWWRLRQGLRNAGISGGVVRDPKTQAVIMR